MPLTLIPHISEMPRVKPKPLLSSRVIGTYEIDWKRLKFIQPETFKELGTEEKQHLKNSVIKNNFAQPFYVWEDTSEGELYCLDGKHRVMILEELIADGYEVPKRLPATHIECENKYEAASLVIIYSSIYAKVTQQGLFDFIQLYDLEYETLRQQIDLPEFSIDRFEQKFDMFNAGEESEDVPDTDVGEIHVQAGDLFTINGHRILCGSFSDPDVLARLMDGKKARILNCDPPYNLPANFFLVNNDKIHGHKNFKMAAGEMTDEQFVVFLRSVMWYAVQNTVPGAIHYIFMDWRHIWHMTEAARAVYGSPIPKQVCVWNKDTMAMGSFYRSKHELCFVFSNNEAKALWQKDMLDHGGFYKENNELVFVFKSGGDDIKHLSHLDLKDRIRTNVWNYPSSNSRSNPDRKELQNHPTPKSVEMISDSILDTTNPGDIVLDFFLGSGTCLIASEKSGRLCYGTELEPKYMQLIIKRYLAYCNHNGIEVTFRHLNGKLTLKHFKNEPVIQ